MDDTQHTRGSILKASKDLFSKHGYDGVSMSLIAKQVGIRKSSLYYFFKNKADIYQTIVTAFIEELIVGFDAPLIDSPADQFKYMLSHILSVGEKYGGILLHIDVNTLSLEELKELKGQKKLFYMSLIDFLKRVHIREPALAAHVILSTVTSYIRCKQFDACPPTQKKFVNYLCNLFIFE